MGRFGAALAYPDFRALWTANAFAQAAAWGLIVARGSLIYDRTESSFLVGVVTFATLGPQFIVPPIIGVLADRMDRRTILSWTYAVNGVQTGLLALLILVGALEIWMLIVLSVVNGVSRSAQMPTSQAFAASLVPREKLLNALSLNASTQHGSRLIGPGFVTPLLVLAGGSTGYALAIGICAAFYFIGMTQIKSITPRPPEKQVTESFLANFVGGLQYVYARPVLRFMLILVFLHCGLTMAFESLLPTFSVQRLGTSEGGFGALIMGVGAGAFIASIFVSGIETTKARGNAMIAMGILSGLGQVLLSFTTTLVMATGAAVIMGGAEAAFMTMGQAVTQSIASDEYRGRVASINAFSLGGIMATMNLLNGSLADEVGAQALLFTHGIIFVSIMVLSMFMFTGRRVYGRAPALEAQPA
jgi:MFS family permease